VVRIVVFDLDDTLYPERDYALSAFEAVGRYLESARGISGLARIATSLFNSGLRNTIYDRALALLGVTPDQGLVKKLVDVHRSHTPTMSWACDARAFVGRASAAGLAFGIVTDGFRECQEAKIRALGISEEFEPIILTDVWGRAAWKPSPRGFCALMEHYGGAPSDFVYIADNPAKDFIAPNKLGWRTLRIRRSGGEYERLEPLHVGAAAEVETPTLDAVDVDKLARGQLSDCVVPMQ
jgi:putative hydrolase of the HAD superfamily